MGSTTGIELGPDFCVLVAVRPRGAGSTDVLALHCIERSEWPLRDTGVSEALRAARAAKKFPRKARLVVWGLPEGATRDDPVATAMLRPVIAAGFRADAVLSPPEALAALAASRPRPGASGPAAWLAVNVHGAAIAIVRGQDLLFARTLRWSYNPVIAGSRAQLLQRYSLVAQLGPEIRHGIAAVLSTHGASVGTVITCGDLPELRSLTMPLIEELDLEVETLDSTEGLKAVGRAKMERFAESAPAIRLACAAALPVSGSTRRRPVGWMPVAAGIAFAAAAGWAVLVYTNRGPGAAEQVKAPRTASVVSAGRSSSAVTPAPPPTATAPAVPESRPGSPFLTPSASAAHPTPVTPKIPVPSPVPSASNTPVAPPRPTGERPLPPAVPVSPSASVSKPAPAVTLPPPAAPGTSAPSSKAAPAAPLRPPAAQGIPTALPSKPVLTTTVPGMPAPVSRPAAGAASTAPPERVAPTVNPPLAPREPAPAPKIAPPPSTAAPAASMKSREPSPADPAPPERGEQTAVKRAVPLKEPLPRLDSILIDQDRRLAVLDGVVVHVGDSVGARIVSHIARDGVLLREPSGLVLRLPLH
jgi:hypothetical protein